MRSHHFLLSIVVFFSFLSSSQGQQGYTISGIVKDNVNEGLIGATVSLLNERDSFVTGTSADMEGHFALSNIIPGSYRLRVTYLGFDDYSRSLILGDAALNLGIIKMGIAKTKTLNEVKIVDKAPPVQQKDDTTQFNAGSYKVNPDATAEDLIRKMPGMDLSSGKPQAQGEQVTKVLVDGKPFFGDDPTSSLRNLPAEVIDKIQVYDERSEQSQFTGFDDGNTSKTINIVTKADRRRGVFGRLYAGGGTDGTQNKEGNYDFKYNTGGSLNYFEGNRRVSLIGQSNNINNQNFSPQDLLGISGGSGGRNFGGGGRRGGGGNNGPFATSTQDGISKTNAVGLNYSDKWGKKIDVTASYFFNNTNNVTEQTIRKNYVVPSLADQSAFDTSKATSNNYNHRFNMRFNYNIDSSNSLLFIPSLSFQNNDSRSSQLSQTLRNETEQLNRSDNTYSSNLGGYNFNSMLMYRHKFKKKGRTLSLWANGGINQNDGNTELYAPVATVDSTYTLNQYADVNKKGWNINSNLSYTEPLTTKSYLQLQYGLNYQESSSDKRTYNFSDITSAYSDLDSLLSNRFSTDYLTHKGGFAYRYTDTNFNFNIGVDFQNANLNNVRALPFQNTITRSFNNILPNARFQYNFSKKTNLRIFYRTSTNAPSVDQLQDVINNSNPLQQSSGNPDLIQSYDHRLFLRFSTANTDVGSTFFAMLSGSLTQDYIGNSTIIADSTVRINKDIVLKEGEQFSRPENLDGYYNVRAFTTYGLPVSALKSNLNINASAGYVRTPGLINQQMNYANNTTLGLGLVLSSNISEKLDFTLSSNSNYNIVQNTLNKSSDSRFLNQSSRLALNYIFWKGIVFNTELNHQYFYGLSAGYNQNFLLWNLSVAKKVFRNQQGEVKLTVYDLLKQNNNITTNITETYTQYAMTNVLRQYFMLTFTYNLRFFKGGATMKDAEGSKERGMPPFHGSSNRGGPPHGMDFGGHGM